MTHTFPSTAPTSKITLVVAGSYSQFLDWCDTNRIHERNFRVKYIRRPEELYGYNAKGAELVKYGTWYLRKEIVQAVDEWEAMAKMVSSPSQL